MYEHHFGISGPPFQLSPDPSFYFDSAGHHAALELLRSRLAEPHGLITVSGEIGAGKTTLVRTLLSEFEQHAVTIGHVVSTQLDLDDLLKTICIALGATPAASASDARQALHVRLGQIAERGGRSVLFVDEAQNLQVDAVLALDELDAQARRDGRGLTICLVGQPELRTLLASPPLAPLAGRIGVSYHLEPLGVGETGAYVLHRLAKVGWKGLPRFETDAFVAIHAWSHGVPRRINQLCNRLMLTCFLTGDSAIDAARVRQVGGDLDAELGGRPPPAFSPMRTAAAPAEARPAEVSSRLAPDPPVLTQVALPGASRSLLVVVGSQADHFQAAALLRAIGARTDLPVGLLVRCYANNAFDRNREVFAGLDVDGRVVPLGIAGGTCAGRAAELMQRFEFVVEQCQSAAVIVFDGSDAALSCGLVASRKAVPVVHVGAGLRARGQPGAADITRKLTDQLADVLYTAELEASERLVQEGTARDRVAFVGSLQIDALQMALRASLAGGPRERAGLPVEYLSDRNGYGLVVLDAPCNVNDKQTMSDLLAILREVSRDVPLVWPMHARTREQLVKLRLDATLRGERIACLAEQSYVSFVQLLANATCVLTDSWHVQEEATALGIPCLALGNEAERPIASSVGSTVAVGRNKAIAIRTIWDCVFNGGKRGTVPELWDGQTGARIAEHLALWLQAAQRPAAAPPALSRVS